MVARSGSAGRGRAKAGPPLSTVFPHTLATEGQPLLEWEIGSMAVDMFLKLDGIKGESKDHKHKDEIHIESFSWGMNQTASGHTGGGHGAGKVQIHDISVRKYVDTSAAQPHLDCCSRKHIKNGLLTVRKAGEKPV